MRVENAKIKITIPIPIDKSDCNRIVYTEKAIEKAVNNLHKNLPIIYRDNESVIDGAAEVEVNETKDGKVTDFKIISIDISK